MEEKKRIAIKEKRSRTSVRMTARDGRTRREGPNHHGVMITRDTLRTADGRVRSKLQHENFENQKCTGFQV